MKINLLFFAAVAEATGINKTSLEVSEGTTSSELLQILCKTYPKLLPYRSVLKIAMNEIMTEPGEQIEADSNVAVFPPFSGG